ncbi:MAG: serine hydrolase [Planctomycetota bacterium]
MFRVLLLLGVFLSVELSLLHAQDVPPDEIGLSHQGLQKIETYLQRQCDEGRIAGAVAAVARHGRVGFLRAVGHRDLEFDVPMRADSLFRIASMTKAITSAAVMSLVEEGSISLDDPVSKHLPEFKRNQKGLPTIHDLLTHRSGLTYGWFGPEELDTIYRENKINHLFEPTAETMGDRVERIAKLPLKFEPRTAWDYGVSTDVLGRVIEVASGQTLDQFFKERFLRPLGMNDTFFHVPKNKQSRLASLYTIGEDSRLERVGSKPIQKSFFRFSADYCTVPGKFYSGGGGLVSSTGDYLRFLHMLLRGGELDGVRVLRQETVAAMTRNQIGDMTIYLPGHGDGFGFGFGVVTDRGADTDEFSVGSYSWGGIFNTYFWVDPQQELVGVLMTQVFPNDHLSIRDDFRELAYAAIDDSVSKRTPDKQPRKDNASPVSDGQRVQVHSAEATKPTIGQVTLLAAEYKTLDCYKIKTPTAVYYLDKVGAGLAGMVDADGNDWLSFDPKEGTGAAGEYRGFPNAVFQEAGSYFHARNSGTDPCITTIETQTEDRVVISAESDNGKWAARYTFTPSECTFTMTKKPEGHPYWVLYEGTPGGQYDDSDWWMTARDGKKRPMGERHDEDLPGMAETGEWIAFGDNKASQMLVLRHLEDDAHPDRFYEMESKMTVFGFGRAGMKKYLSTVPQSFSIGFRPATKTLTAEASEAPSPRRAKMQFAFTNKGNAQAGAKLFHDQRTKCSTCHQVGKEGGRVGPDLSNIGGKFDRPHLIDSLLYPSRQIGYGYETTIILTEDGRTISGIAKEATDSHITLLDSTNKNIRVARSEIVESKVSKTSIMPSGLEGSLSDQEFVDLVAYLETLGRGKAKFGGGVSGPITLAEGFQLTTVATGLSGAVAMEIAPDGRLFICEQSGTLKVSPPIDSLTDGPQSLVDALSIPVELDWERGLIGVTVAPDFPSSPHVYVVYVTDKPHTHHRVSRFTIVGDSIDPNSEVLLLEGDDQSKFGGNVPAGHQGGGIHFGPDGKLYIGIGEQTAGKPAQQMNALQGKLLRINRDGSIPDDNPFDAETSGKYRSIWAKGCRNPFTFAFSRSGDMLVNDVGGKFEEVNRGAAGANYGWPGVDHGPTQRAGITGSIHHYPQSCINGGDFCESDRWPNEYRDKYFFADFNQGWVKYIDPKSPGKSHPFLKGVRRPVDLRFAPDGSLYVLLRNAWVVDDKFQGGTGALLRISRTSE